MVRDIQKMKTKRAAHKVKILTLFLFIITVSCQAPKTKEEYLNNFEKFVDRVEQNHKKYNKKDWEWADSQFEKYNKKWYLKFKGEYSLENQIKIKALIIEYNSFRNKENLGEIIKELFEKDVNKMKEKVENYVEEDLDEDVEKLIEGATEIGDSAVKVLEDIIEKIDHSF